MHCMSGMHVPHLISFLIELLVLCKIVPLGELQLPLHAEHHAEYNAEFYKWKGENKGTNPNSEGAA
jgi:hypothetical protein